MSVADRTEEPGTLDELRQLAEESTSDSVAWARRGPMTRRIGVTPDSLDEKSDAGLHCPTQEPEGLGAGSPSSSSPTGRPPHSHPFDRWQRATAPLGCAG